MQVLLRPIAARYFERLSATDKKRFKNALNDLSNLRKELQDYIAIMPERNLAALRPLLSVLAEPPYTVETDLTAEEKAMIDEGMAEYRANPSSFIPLENLN